MHGWMMHGWMDPLGEGRFSLSQSLFAYASHHHFFVLSFFPSFPLLQPSPKHRFVICTSCYCHSYGHGYGWSAFSLFSFAPVYLSTHLPTYFTYLSIPHLNTSLIPYSLPLTTHLTPPLALKYLASSTSLLSDIYNYTYNFLTYLSYRLSTIACDVNQVVCGYLVQLAAAAAAVVVLVVVVVAVVVVVVVVVVAAFSPSRHELYTSGTLFRATPTQLHR
ncbi:uncharacterized protein J3D65DRAFT_2734 [Phyllosticta citribraziliensis]|uniref:Uncharacterized protein n=1 Tax=Phyllosticta citribraziliensis TaxID=989973 RepID=A0ABR1M9A1_9PEZI